MDRRNFIKSSVAGIAALSGMRCSPGTFNSSSPGKIALVKTRNRKEGVQRVLKMMDLSGMNNKNVLIKPNFNSAHDTPGSTHMDVIGQLVTEIQERGVRGITVGESSGPGNTQEIMETKGVFDMASDMKFDVINYDTMPETDWVDMNPEGNHWDNGFSVPRHVVNAEYNVATCCLKTHAYGGVFTMSLKLAVGLTPESLRRPLHQKRDTFMRHMISEINLGYDPKLIVLDGVDAFVDGGPSTGDIKQGDVILAGTDRVAIDAAGVAILKHLGANDAIMNTPIFEHDQIKHAAHLGIGLASPDMIEFVTADDESKAYAETLKSILLQG
ncbi:DUF362 domain-containing protein [candidate division KSB1 bacterium]